MHLGKSLLSLIFCLSIFISSLNAQNSFVYTEANQAYKKALTLYDSGTVGLAQVEFKRVIDRLRPVHDTEAVMLRTKAELYYAKCAVRLEQPDGEKLIIDFARKYDPDPLANQAMLEMADFYFNKKDYEKAAQLYSSIDVYDLGRDQHSEVKFKQGYSLFVKKKFTQARTAFGEIRDIQNKYYYPSNYYYGMTSFYENKYTDAITSFEKVGRSKKYSPYIPYYITQIYFAQGKYDKVIKYAGPKSEDKKLKNLPEINHLLGKAYFEKGDYRKALPYLEYFADNAKKLRPEDLYQLGYVHYKDGKYEKAIKRLNELGSVSNAMGQNAMYILGDAYIKTDQLNKARNAFRAASKMKYDKSTQEEALFNYAKLSYELNYDKEAIATLEKVPVTSKYYQESQTILSSIFLNTRDYDNALKTLEGMPSLTPELRKTYQKVAYLKGIQLYRAENYKGAEAMFEKSLQQPIDNRTKALAIYWLGEIAHRERRYKDSEIQMNKFLRLAKNIRNLPDESSIYTANYIQGYNYLEQKDYSSAQSYFQKASAALEKNATTINNTEVAQRIQGDAILRTGDAYFKRNKYDEAIKYYDKAIEKRYKGFEYALYQKAMIEGLRGNQTSKIIALDEIVDNYGRSAYADNALLQLGITYLELSKYEQATKPLKQLLENYPTSTLKNQAILKLGLISYNQGNLEASANYYKRIFGNNPTGKETEAALTALEEIYVDDLAKPEIYFAFIETIPGYKVEDDDKEKINFKAAATQYENGKYQKAVSSLNNYISLYPNGRNIIKARFYRGDSYAALKNYTEALSDFEKVIKKGNSSYYKKALKKAAVISFYHKKDYEKAYQYYSDLEVYTDKPVVRLDAQEGALKSAYELNNEENITKYVGKILQNPDASVEQRTIANFYSGKIAMAKKAYTKALQAFNEVVKNSNDENTAETRYLIAYIYYVQRDLDVAEQITMNANKESSEYPYWVAKNILLLADILAERGDVFNAQAVLEGFVENYNGDAELVKIAKDKLAKLKVQEAQNSRFESSDTTTLELYDGN